MYKNVSREFVIVENIRLVCLLDLTADFGVKTNAKRREELIWYSELRAVCTQ